MAICGAKAASQYDAAPYVRCANLQNMKLSNYDFLVIRCKNLMERNVRIESKSVLVSRYIMTSFDVRVTEHNIWCSVVL